MGTNEFAVPILQRIINEIFFDITVYTKAPKSSGRGLNTQKSLVHQLAEKHKLAVYTPRSLRTEQSLEEFKKINADVVVVAAYGLLLPSEVLSYPKFGCINVHPSALPRWRGAAPIQRTIMIGDTETEVCVMKMDEGMDTGDVISRRKVAVSDEISSGALSKICADIGAAMIIKNLYTIQKTQKSLPAIPQDENGVTYATKIDRNEEVINWANDAVTIHHKIRALSPKPGAYFLHNGNRIKILSAELCEANTQEVDEIYKQEKNGDIGNVYKNNQNVVGGTIVFAEKDSDLDIIILCGSGGKYSFIRPLIVQREGSRIMSFKDFLRGYSFNANEILPNSNEQT
jgi:methionyl-tRNA formyltransferase